MYLIFTLIICLGISFLFTLLAKKLRLSNVIGLIIGGLILGSPILKEAILKPNINFISNLGEVGFISLMFLAGLEISWSMLYKEKKDALFVASFAAAVPLLLGFIIFWILGFSLLTSLIIGICMSITAEATKARILLELKKLKTKLGALMMGAGILDDIFGMALFIIIIYLLTQGFITKELIILMVAIMALFVGILVHKLVGRTKSSVQYFEKFLLYAIVPFFFITMGIHFSLSSLILDPILVVIIISIAISGKMIGTLLTKPFTKLKFKQLYLIGWGMNSRGAIELAIVFVAFKLGLLPITIYSSLVIMALITTLLFAVIFTEIVKKDPKIMN